MVKVPIFQNCLKGRISLKTMGQGTVMVPVGVPVINNKGALRLASQDLVSYKGIGKAFPACVGPTKESTAIL